MAAMDIFRSETGSAPMRPGVVAELAGHTLHAEVCRAVLDHDSGSAESPHPELNMNHPDCGTPLHWAVARRIRDAALALVGCRHFLLVNARLAIDGSTALHMAAAEGMHEVVEALLQRADFAAVGGVDRDNFTPLHGAAFRGHIRCAFLLLKHPGFGAAAGAIGAFDVARPTGHWAKEAAGEYDMTTALHMAAARNHAEICEAILTLSPSLSNSADVTNRIGANALHIAARAGNTAACVALLMHMSTEAVNAHDARGFTALHWAAHQASGDICAALLERQDFEALERRDLRGRTANDIAQEKGHFEVQRLILARLGALGLQLFGEGSNSATLAVGDRHQDGARSEFHILGRFAASS
eukprot:TRINITY_DN68365_c0_g1_i1.p1 TRINITY_DN68365_c0_g1~~TRINITY_DN68365_c0_g1_i1.p1  ORF type:complete len:356 (+),score=47.22 TRINITY_DN68365_c0_g1_i1:55-1122(+)